MQTATEKLKELVCKLYAEQPLSVDKLPYSDEFDHLHIQCMTQLEGCQIAITERSVWLTLMACRKDGSLPRKSDKRIVNKKQPLRDKVSNQPQGFGRI